MSVKKCPRLLLALRRTDAAHLLSDGAPGPRSADIQLFITWCHHCQDPHNSLAVEIKCHIACFDLLVCEQHHPCCVGAWGSRAGVLSRACVSPIYRHGPQVAGWQRFCCSTNTHVASPAKIMSDETRSLDVWHLKETFPPFACTHVQASIPPAAYHVCISVAAPANMPLWICTVLYMWHLSACPSILGGQRQCPCDPGLYILNWFWYK